MNNDGYASIRNTQRNYFEERYVGTGPESGLVLPDLEKLSLTYDIMFEKVTDASELDVILKKCMGLNQPVIIDVQLVKNEVLLPKVSALPQKDGSIYSMPLEDMTPLLPLKVLESEMITSLLYISIKANRDH